MMKKNGFTLAEVLITLAIIGVVATLTLPALMTNTQEQQARTAIKKGMNTLTEAAQMSQAISGFDYASFNSADTTNTEGQTLYGMLATRTTMDFTKSGTATTEAALVNNGSSNYVAFFRDGSALAFDPATTVMNSTGTGISANQADGIVYGISAIYDTNGSKGPNLISNCKGNAAMTAQNASKDNDSDCTDKKNRVIRDQFGVRLRAGFAVPNGAAARWAVDN